MKAILLILPAFLLFSSCEKNSRNTGENPSVKNEVAIYLLKSSRQEQNLCKIDASTAVLADTPFIKNDEILEYFKSSQEFKLAPEASGRIARLGERTGFAVTVDKKVIYYGFNMPVTMSSTCPHSITMHVSTAQQDRIVVQLGYPEQAADPGIKDERNNAKLLTALDSQNKLR